MSCQIIFRHRFWVYLDLWKKSCSRKSLVKTLRWVKMLKSYSCFLCLSWRFWSSTAKEHCCFTSITLIQLKFQFHQWTRYDHYDIPYFKSLTEHFIHWIPGTTSQGTNLDESSVSNSSSNSINGRGMAILIYHIKSLQEHFINWISGTTKFEINFDESSVSLEDYQAKMLTLPVMYHPSIGYFILLSNKMKYVHNNNRLLFGLTWRIYT